MMDKASVREVGTLKYFRERVMRYNVHPDIKKDIDAFQDFFLSVGKAYLMEAFLEFFGMNSVQDSPTTHIPRLRQSRMEENDYFNDVFGEFVDKYVFQSDIDTMQTEPQDRVFNYGLCVIEFVVLLMEMIDTVHEGDGQRLILNMKYFLLMFRAKSTYSKYALEVMRFITQVKCTLTAQLSQRVLYGRFSNTTGKIGGNIATDLLMEHKINGTKVIINAMGANKTMKAVERATKAVHGQQEITFAYDQTAGVTATSIKHTRKSSDADEQVMMDDLRKLRPFSPVAGRSHPSFPLIPSSTTSWVDWPKLHQWLSKHKRRMVSNQAVEEDSSEDED